MDGGLLSDQDLLAASRDFVCVRPLTYEDSEEGAFLKQLGGSSDGGVRNTTFVILAPDGETRLTASGRSPQMVFRGAADPTVALLERMAEIAEEHPGNDKPRHAQLPYLVDVRRALNVASADNQPLVIVSTRSAAKRTRIEKALAPVAWSDELRGRFAFAAASSTEELVAIEDAPKGDQVLVVQPNEFGLEGIVLASTNRVDTRSLRAVLERGLLHHTLLDKSREVVRRGERLGLSWEPEDLEMREPDPDNVGRARRRGGRDEDRGGEREEG